MSFSDLIQTVNLTPLDDGDAELLDRVPQEADTGWDSMRDTWLLRKDAAETDPHTALASFASIARGAQVTGKNMWIQTRSARCVGPGLFVAEVVSNGLLSNRGYKVRYDSGANVQSGGPVEVASTVYAKVSAREPQVTADVEYVVVAGLQPGNVAFYTAAVGTAKTPPAGWSPTVKASVWDYLTEFTYWYPNGWLLDGCQVENLPGLDTVWYIRERYQYQYAKSL